MQNINIKNIIIIQSYANLQEFLCQPFWVLERFHVGTYSSYGQPGGMMVKMKKPS